MPCFSFIVADWAVITLGRKAGGNELPTEAFYRDTEIAASLLHEGSGLLDVDTVLAIDLSSMVARKQTSELPGKLEVGGSHPRCILTSLQGEGCVPTIVILITLDWEICPAFPV